MEKPDVFECIKAMETEVKCVKQADACDRDCAKCPLVMDTKHLLSCYEEVLRILKLYSYTVK